ncbi:uncharacterized protein LOC128468811 [Spea bombifrons]|uniref:uncharacterized protein LOC128468811 n=1 Tax=Spea bombifrons TaxID=233779 RepID=UPI00234A7D94|nr:uncharacterized protein LOC128468811 [Spea bombifrons]
MAQRVFKPTPEMVHQKSGSEATKQEDGTVSDREEPWECVKRERDSYREVKTEQCPASSSLENPILCMIVDGCHSPVVPPRSIKDEKRNDLKSMSAQIKEESFSAGEDLSEGRNVSDGMTTEGDYIVVQIKEESVPHEGGSCADGDTSSSTDRPWPGTASGSIKPESSEADIHTSTGYISRRIKEEAAWCDEGHLKDAGIDAAATDTRKGGTSALLIKEELASDVDSIVYTEVRHASTNVKEESVSHEEDDLSDTIVYTLGGDTEAEYMSACIKEEETSGEEDMEYGSSGGRYPSKPRTSDNVAVRQGNEEDGMAGLNGSKGDKGDTDARTAEMISTLEDKIALLEKNINLIKRLLQYSLKGAKVSGDKVYVPIDLTADYSGAQAACEREGGTLPTPTNSAEDAAIHEVAKELKIYVFLGINDRKEEGVFMYLDGKKINYSNWRQNEPNGKKAENCVEIPPHVTGWIDRACDIKRRVVCEF